MRPLAPACILAAVTAVLTGCSGPSHNVSTGAVCQRLNNDFAQVKTAQQPTKISGEVDQLKTLAAEVKTATRNAEEQALRAAGQRAIADVERVLRTGDTGKASNAQPISLPLGQVKKEFQPYCPTFAGR